MKFVYILSVLFIVAYFGVGFGRGHALTIQSSVSISSYLDTLPTEDSTYLLIDTAIYRVSRADSTRYEQLKSFNPSWWEKLNRDNLCTGMKPVGRYQNGKIVPNN